MKHILLVCGAGLASAAVLAQEVGTVVSARPVLQQVAVPRLVCQDQQVTVTRSPSGAGAVVGAIAGGVLGSAFGGGSGQVAAAAIGALGGAVIGNQAEAQPQQQLVQNCSTQTFYESRATHYDVVYEYAGKRFSTQMANDPGSTVQLQVTPVGSVPQQAAVRAPARIVSSSSYAQPSIEQVTVYQTQQPIYTYPAPVYTQPVYAAPSFVAPLAIGLGIGYIGGHFSSRGRGYYGPPRHHHRH